MSGFKRTVSRAASGLAGCLFILGVAAFWFTIGCLGLTLIASVNPGLDWGFWDVVKMGAGITLAGILFAKPGSSS